MGGGCRQGRDCQVGAGPGALRGDVRQPFETRRPGDLARAHARRNPLARSPQVLSETQGARVGGGRGSGGCLGRRPGDRGAFGKGLSGRGDAGEDRPHVDRLALAHQQVAEHTGGRRRQLRVDLVRLQLGDRLTLGHGVARLLQPAGQSPLGEGVRQPRQLDIHGRTVALTIPDPYEPPLAHAAHATPAPPVEIWSHPADIHQRARRARAPALSKSVPKPAGAPTLRARQGTAASAAGGSRGASPNAVALAP